MGQPVSSTRYESGAAYKTEVTGYDAEYRPTGSKTTIPDVPATKGLAGTYTSSVTYTPTGKVQSSTLPATPGGLAAEKLVTRYNADGMPQTQSGLAWYTADIKYSPFGEVLRTASGSAPNRLWTTNFYNPNTGQVTHQISDRETGPNRISDVSYAYDPAGNITSVNDGQPGGRADIQCYAYDPMGRLAKAWTGKTEGCTGPSPADVTPGPDGDGYWQEYQFDAIGNRTKLIDHDLTSSALDDETTYTYGITVAGNGTQPPSKTQPHALAQAEKTTRTPGSTVTSLNTYTYDASGNTKSRRINGDTQTLSWDRRNKVTSATSPGIGAVAVTGASGKCIDVKWGSTADGTPVQIWPCNESKAQRWRLSGDTVRALDKCLTTSGTKLVLATCDGSDKQKFVYRASDKSLNNPATNQCVDVPNNAVDGSDLQLWSCNATGPQQFSFDNTTTYIYDAGGNRLIEETGSSRTLYLGDTEVTVNKAGQAVDAVRYYSSPGAPTTVRRTQGKATGHSLSVLTTDHHGTATTSVDAASGQAVTRRKSDPYGNPRGGQPANWPGDHTFLGTGVDDSSTGLTHIGAREYEPSTGRFVSVDPIIDITDPLQMNGYTYANGNPITNSDPSGLMIYEGMDSGGISSGGCGGCNIVNHPEQYHSIGFKSYYYPKDYDSYIEMGPVKVHYTSQKALDNAFAAVKKREPKLFEKYNWVANCMYKDGRCNATSVPVLPYLSHVMCNMDGITCEDSVDNIGYMMGLGLFAELENGGELEKGINKIVFSDKPAARLKSKPAECKNSFVSGTRVLLADGTSKPIEELKPDDKVLATDPETGETTSEVVTAAIRTEDDKEYVDLTIETADGPKNITTTDHHPFWSESDRQWRDAAALTPGTHLRAADGESVTLTSVRTYRTNLTTHNLTVAALHTYYVLAGATPVLVHNSSGLCGPGVRTASEAGISPNDARRIQNAADKAGQPIIVVGSRASGTANPASDWDYILTGPSRSRHSQQNSLPRGTGDGEGSGRGRDFWQNYNPSRPDYAELDPSKPHVVFEPRSR